MSRLHCRIFFVLWFVTLTCASFGQTSTIKFKDSGILMAGSSAETGFAQCQPLRGDLAEISGKSQKAYGAEVLPVRVTSGLCVGNSGWVGVSRIEVGSTVPASNDLAQFSYSDSLFDMLSPKMVKAACQPLRGDTVRILEATRLIGTDVYRVTVLSGRCQGAAGWVGGARLERVAADR